tara:strand:- start:844 stop:1158 length:315 start_codon:yes stop_codon:yes gene_type:complete
MNNQIIYLKKSTNPDKKYMVLVGRKTIHFGSEGMSDYTKHKDPDRKKFYIDRHQKNENWTKSGISTAGFWSRYLLWGEPTIKQSIEYLENRFNITIKRTWPPKI